MAAEVYTTLMISNKMKQNLVKAGIAGGILSAATTVLYGGGPISINGMDIPAAVPLFVAGAGSSLITDVIHDQLNMTTTSAQKLADISTLAISSGISGAVAAGLLTVVGLPSESLLPVFAIAAGAQAGSDYIVVKFLETSTGELIF